MRFAIAALAFAAAVNAVPQGVTSAVSPSSPAPSGCSGSYSGSFEITVVNVTSSSKRDLIKRQSGPNGPSTLLVLTLASGVLKDAQGRTGYIASNYQFQFDNPPQAGAIYTAGFSVCSNSSLALGGSALWYQCYTGGFYNLYNTNWAPQCSPIYIEVIGGASSSAAASGSVATSVTQLSDGQPKATTVAVTVKTDGQPNAPVSQISDGQPQGPAPSAVSIRPEGQPTVGTGAASSASPVSIRPEGQPTVGSASASASPVSIRPEGQPTVGSASAASSSPVSIRPEGQPTVGGASSATSSAKTSSAVSVRPEGQPTVGGSNATVTTASSKAATFTGAAPTRGVAGDALAAIAGIVGAVALL